MQWRELTVILDWHRKDKFTTIHVSRTFVTKMFQEIHVHSSLLKKTRLARLHINILDLRLFSIQSASFNFQLVFILVRDTPPLHDEKHPKKDEEFSTAMQSKEITYHLNRSGRNRWKVKNQMAVR